MYGRKRVGGGGGGIRTNSGAGDSASALDYTGDRTSKQTRLVGAVARDTTCLVGEASARRRRNNLCIRITTSIRYPRRTHIQQTGISPLNRSLTCSFANTNAVFPSASVVEHNSAGEDVCPFSTSSSSAHPADHSRIASATCREKTPAPGTTNPSHQAI